MVCAIDMISFFLQQEPGAGFSTIPVSSSSPAQCSPMAISPSISTLNTPRGSITSMRSQQRYLINLTKF